MSAFVFAVAREAQPPGTTSMDKLNPTIAQQIAETASAFQLQRTGHMPKSVAVILSEDTLVITLHGALSPAETALAMSPAGAAQMQEFHKRLFMNSADALRQEIKRITGVEVREATAEIEPTTGTVVQAFTSGTVVQVFLLAGSAPAGSWRGMTGEKMQRNGRESVDVARRPPPSIDEAHQIGAQLGIDWTKVDCDQFRRGLEVELEHGARDPETNVTNNDLALTGKIAWAHLKEFPDYYLRSDRHGAEADDDGMARADREHFHRTPAALAGRKES